MNINSALSNLTICDQKYAFLKKMDAKKQIQTIIKPIVGTNGYTVGIYVIGAFHNLVAGVLSPNNKQITLPQSKILNALTGQVLSHEQFKLIITSHEDAFCAIYLPETNKVYIWPHLKAEGRESHTGY
ncbi:MAG TPA: hypothetical protein PKD00_09315, partial [Burkholderiales bacterium]|nr:hypothetical protein [Burkholderiales bacterium]